MDEIDDTLIELLVENARMPVANLATKMNLARSTVQARLERLEQRGIITGYTVRLGDEITVQVAAASIVKRMVDFVLIGGPTGKSRGSIWTQRSSAAGQRG